LVSQPASFDPERAQITWQIAAADYAEYAVLLPLMARARRSAPLARIAVRGASHASMIKQLDSGDLDLGLMAVEAVPGHLRYQVLYREQYVLVARKGHPALRRRLSVERMSQLEYIVVSPEGGGFRGVTDLALESLGRKRRVLVSTQHFLFVPELVARTDLVAMVPSRLVRDRSRLLQVVAPPVAIAPFDMAMIWHERSHLDPAHEWLREQVRLSVQ
jgi:DNA-binding transcriptional LysR family regulator